MDQFRPRFLGQAKLIGDQAWRSHTPPADAMPPADGNSCVFIGGRSFSAGAAIDGWIKDAQGAGYTDVRELDVPPCVPSEGPGGMCLVSSNSPSKYVWACLPAAAPNTAAPAVVPASVPLPGAPEAPPDSKLLPIAAGVGAATIFAALVGGLFRK